MDASTLAQLDSEDRILVELADTDEGFVGTVESVHVSDEHAGATVRVAVDDVVDPGEWDPGEEDSRESPSKRDPDVGTQQTARNWDEEAVLISSDSKMKKPEIKPARDEKTRANPRDDVLASVESIERDLGSLSDMDH